MKTRILITLTILAFNATLIFGNTNSYLTNHRPVENKGVCLAPTPPIGADFTENVPEAPVDYHEIAPVAPMEATFDEEAIPETTSIVDIMKKLSPSTPVEADFEEDADHNGIFISLIPAAPKEADFEDLL